MKTHEKDCSHFKICGGRSQMVGILPGVKEKQADLLSSQGGIVTLHSKGGTSALTE